MDGHLTKTSALFARIFSIAIIVSGLLTMTSSSGVQSQTSWIFADFTGYAMGNEYVYGHLLSQGDFANHLKGYCNDPAADWQNGTEIYTSDWIQMRNQSGSSVYYSRFVLRDVGDLNCLMGNYWVDIYFGRYKYSNQVCSCPGVSNSICTNAYANSCTDATNFGRSVYAYQVDPIY
ncbi:MAG: hypothetical protein WA110_04440 [Anaerolineaceae bacterium]